MVQLESLPCSEDLQENIPVGNSDVVRESNDIAGVKRKSLVVLISFKEMGLLEVANRQLVETIASLNIAR